MIMTMDMTGCKAIKGLVSGQGKLAFVAKHSTYTGH